MIRRFIFWWVTPLDSAYFRNDAEAAAAVGHAKLWEEYKKQRDRVRLLVRLVPIAFILGCFFAVFTK